MECKEGYLPSLKILKKNLRLAQRIAFLLFILKNVW